MQAAHFDVSAELAALSAGRTDIGGVGCFVGTVRAERQGRAGQQGPALQTLVLEHYAGMTEAAMAAIAAEAAQRWDLLGCTLVHRVGALRPGEPIVLVLAASRHRQAALEATAFLIDWLKTRAPFWKKEVFSDGTELWVEARTADEAAAERWR